MSLDKLLCKDIKNKKYEKYWEVSDEIPTNIKYVVSIYDNKVLNLEEGNKIIAQLHAVEQCIPEERGPGRVHRHVLYPGAQHNYQCQLRNGE